MVTKNCNFSIAVIVELNLLIYGSFVGVNKIFAFCKFLLQSYGSIESPKDFSWQVFHTLFKIVIKSTRIHSIKDIIIWFFSESEPFKKLMNDRNHFDRVEVAHRVLTKEIKCDLVVIFKPDVLDTQWAAANCISFVLTLFIPDTQG